MRVGSIRGSSKSRATAATSSPTRSLVLETHSSALIAEGILPCTRGHCAPTLGVLRRPTSPSREARMDALHLRYYLDILITSLLRGSPWLIATVASTALICFSPFGRAIAAALRERRQS